MDRGKKITLGKAIVNKHRLDTNSNEVESDQEGKKTEVRANLKNPYNYNGALHPLEDSLVCIPRHEDVNRVLDGISNRDYWAVLGPREIGKTTFLRLIAKELPGRYYPIGINFELSPKKEENFYEWLKEKILEKDELKLLQTTGKWKKKAEPHMRFLHFLENLKIKANKNGKSEIVFLFDEIEGTFQIKNFLHLWRTVYHDRFEKVELNKYTVIIAGSSDLLKLTVDSKSPFNIAETLFLKDFSGTEIETLLKPFSQQEITIDKKAKKKLSTQISGHPQLLQHTCYLLFKSATESNMNISKKDIDDAINNLFKENSNLRTLKNDIMSDDTLKNLLKDILKGKKEEFHLYQEYSISGSGAIKEVNSICQIRNKVYKKFIKDILKISKIERFLKKRIKISFKKFITYFATFIGLFTALLAVYKIPIESIDAYILVLVDLVLSIVFSIEKEDSTGNGKPVKIIEKDFSRG